MRYKLNSAIHLPYILEFSPAFVVEDHILLKRFHFTGNFTLTAVGGGVGYVENIEYFTEEEILLYNYRPDAR